MNNVKIFDNPDKIIKKVIKDYKKNDTELNSLYFDFPVKLKEKILLNVYAEIQWIINDDMVIRLEDVSNTVSESGNIVKGKAVSFIPDGMYEDVYEGSYKDFLKSFNDRETESGLYRIRIKDIDEKYRCISGYKLDFIL